MSPATRLVEAVTCLGCGCACDDIGVTVEGSRIVSTARACKLGEQWFGDGSATDGARVGGKTVERAAALAEAGRRLGAAAGRGRAMIYLAAELNTDSQRAAVALADRLGARIDSLSSDTVASGILAAQRRGRVGATLGELRHRADVVMYWGVDPAERYPRFAERCLPEATGLEVPRGRADRYLIAVDIGGSRGPADADARLVLSAAEELPALSVMRAAVGGRAPAGLEGSLEAAAAIATRLTTARYCAVIYDAEPGPSPGDPNRAEGLIALAQGLNTPTRAAVCALRAGGNRMGAEQVLTWQTGYPIAVDFSGGAPSYQPGRSTAALLAAGAIDSVLVVGDYRSLPAAVASQLKSGETIVIGPGATGAAPGDAIAIDAARAGIHEGGTAFRLDDVPLPLTAVLPGAATVSALLAALGPGAR
jgi:formylmethanofuran dehydrogenase subunit B